MKFRTRLDYGSKPRLMSVCSTNSISLSDRQILSPKGWRRPSNHHQDPLRAVVQRQIFTHMQEVPRSSPRASTKQIKA